MDSKEMTGPSAPVLDLMEQGATVMRIENENLQAMAIQRPRNLKHLTQSAFEELRAFPQFAEKAFYSIPYKDTNSPTGKTMVEGPSIKASNALARHWGNNSSGFRIVGGDEERILIQGVFIDHETGMRRTAEISVSRKARKKDGTYYTLPADRLNISIQAGGSKAVRNATLNALPIGLVDSYFAEAKRLATRGGHAPTGDAKSEAAQIAAKMQECLHQLEAMGVGGAEVQEYIGRHPELKDEETVCGHLIGVLNAIEDGQTSVEDVFVSDKPIAEPQRASAAPVAPPPAPAAQPKERKIPPDAKRMTSKFSGGICKACKKTIKQGDPLWRNPDSDGWEHVQC